MGDADELRRQLRHALGDSDDDTSERLLAEARAEAEGRVRSILADAYSDLLLERVRAALTPGAPAPARPPTPTEPAEAAPAPDPAAPAPGTDSGELGWYVYCIVAADHDPLPAELEGIDPEHPVGLLEHGGVAAVVSRVPLAEYGEEPLRDHLSDMAWLERTARRHEQVQEEVARGGTPIPMRLCSIYREESGVREMLTREEPALLEAIDHLRGKAEWGVKGFADLNAAGPAARLPDAPESGGSESGPSRGSGGGAAYMQNRLDERRRRETAAARIDEACDAVHAALCALAADGVTSAPHRPEATGRDLPMVLNASYLVADADLEAFHRELDRLGEEVAPLGLALERTGPWPPYNFVPGAIGAAW